MGVAMGVAAMGRRVAIMQIMQIMALCSLGCLIDSSGRGSGSGDGAGSTSGTGPGTTRGPTTTSDVTSTTSTTSTTDTTSSTTAAGTGSTGDGESSSGTGPVELGPFEDPVPIDELNSVGDDDDPTVSVDELEILFKSDRGGNDDLFVAVRASDDASWSMPVAVDELNTNVSEASPRLSSDGRTLLFARDSQANGYEIYVTTREAVGSPWEPPQSVPELNSPGDDLFATLAPSGDEIALCSDRITTYDLFLTEGGLGAVTNVNVKAELSSFASDCGPSFSSDGDTLYFASDRMEAGVAGSNLFVSRRLAGSFFAPPDLVEAVNSDADESDPWISENGRNLYFSREAEDDSDIYVSTRSPVR